MKKKCAVCNKELIISKFHKHQHKYCSAKCRNTAYYINNKQQVKLKVNEYRKNNNEVIKQKKREYYLKNAKTICEKSIEYSKKNRDHLRDVAREYCAKRSKIDPMFKFKRKARNFIKDSFRRTGFSKSIKAETILGCTINEFKHYIEKQLPIGKSLLDLGRYGFHIDHKIALATAKTQEDVIKLCHYTNLQPLWHTDNLRKKDKVLI